MRNFLMLMVLVLAAGGCDVLGDDYDNLAPGTFRFRADGKTYSGTARFYRNEDRPYQEAQIVLFAQSDTELHLQSDDLLEAIAVRIRVASRSD